MAESDCILVVAGRHRVAVLTDTRLPEDAARAAIERLCSIPSGPVAADAVAQLGPASGSADLTFRRIWGGVGDWPDIRPSLAVSCGMAGRLLGQVLPEPIIVVVCLSDQTRMRLRPPARWWSGDWRVQCGRGADALVPADLILHGEIVLRR